MLVAADVGLDAAVVVGRAEVGLALVAVEGRLDAGVGLGPAGRVEVVELAGLKTRDQIDKIFS